MELGERLPESEFPPDYKSNGKEKEELVVPKESETNDESGSIESGSLKRDNFSASQVNSLIDELISDESFKV